MKSQKFLRKEILSVENLRPLVCDNVSKGIVIRVQDTGKAAFQESLFLQLCQTCRKTGKIRLQLTCRDQIHQYFPGKGSLAHQQMAKIARVAQSMVKRKP